VSGLHRLCKLYGSMTINGTKMVWDYVADQPVEASQMKSGSARWKASERARWANRLPDGTSATSDPTS
jgi:hypothetical protein